MAVAFGSMCAAARPQAAGQLSSETGHNAPSPRDAVVRVLPLLQKSASNWTGNAQCISCHHQGLGMMAVAVARERRFPIDEAMLSDEMQAVRRRLSPPDRSVVYPSVVPDFINVSYALTALAAAGLPPDYRTGMQVHKLLGAMHVSGHWNYWSYQPPLEGSEFTATALAVRAIQAFAPPARMPEVEDRINRARAWMANATPRDTEDMSMQLLGLRWAGADAVAIARATSRLLFLRAVDRLHLLGFRSARSKDWPVNLGRLIAPQSTPIFEAARWPAAILIRAMIADSMTSCSGGIDRACTVRRNWV
jgi:hypothetical protein